MAETYYSGGLPQGASIITNLSKDFNYAIGPSKMSCFPFKLRFSYNQVIITLANTTPFLNVFVLGIRCYPAVEAAGQSITSSPYQTQGSPILPPNGLKFNFYSEDLSGSSILEKADIYKAIPIKTTFWMNVQNLQNKENYFYCKFNYFSPGTEYTE